MKEFFTRCLDKRRWPMPWNRSMHELPDTTRKGGVETGLPGYGHDRMGRPKLAATVVVLIAGIVGLSWLSLQINNSENGIAVAGKRVVNEIVRSEVIRILVPSSLVQLATRLNELGPLQSHEDVKACLRTHGLERVWYAMQFRALESNGNVTTAISYVRPFDDPARATEFRAVLARIQNQPSENPLLEFSKATISILPESAADANPGSDLPELMSR